MDKPLILLVEDDQAVQNLLVTTLKLRSYRYVAATTGEQALLAVTTQSFDAILLDLGLPDLDGTQIIEKVRQWSNTPIIVLSARSDDRDKIKALDCGADDYITKPFSVEELLARIRAALRRTRYLANTQKKDSVFVNGALRIDLAAGCAFLEERELHLTPLEYRLLCLLASNVGKVLTHSYIIKAIWQGSTENNGASLRVFMATLRKKIENNPSKPQYIQTHIGIGYRMLKIDDGQ